jgi:hypothetical protein
MQVELDVEASRANPLASDASVVPQRRAKDRDLTGSRRARLSSMAQVSSTVDDVLAFGEERDSRRTDGRTCCLVAAVLTTPAHRVAIRAAGPRRRDDRALAIADKR